MNRNKEYIVHTPENNVLAVEDFITFCGEPIEQLVRCEDCEHWPFQPTSYWQHEVLHVSYTWCHYFKANDYCSHGERRDKND